MTAKQRKNLKKKLNRKRKKMEQSQNTSSYISESQTSKSSMIGTDNVGEEEGQDLKDIEIEDIAVDAKPKEKPENQKKPPKAVNTAS